MQVWPGVPYPLGASYDGSGTNFALFSEVAERVELCLFDADGIETRVKMPEMDGFVWHVLFRYFPGQLYGYRVYVPTILRRGAAIPPSCSTHTKAIRSNPRLGSGGLQLPVRCHRSDSCCGR